MVRRIGLSLSCLLLLAIPAMAQVVDLPAGADKVEKHLVSGKTTIVEFYADW
ncbi:MAG: hypothetical protein AMXMBFR33_09120 [Candidatus Xenobia bacterium]|jgi:hypothetical protein